MLPAMSTRNNLPPEIIEAILGRLPAKSLGRFKCVSKPWSSFISDSQFIKTHLLNNHHHTKLILIGHMNFLYSLDINKLHPYLDTDDISTTGKRLSFRPSSIVWGQILGSCNGIVLARGDFNKIYMINPTTREVQEIPTSPFAHSIDWVTYGFGYDSSTDDYKLISISFLYTYPGNPVPGNNTFVSIYSLRFNSWRKLQNSPFDISNVTPGVLINENLHWLKSTRPGYSSPIVAFSLANEEFKEIKLPVSIDGRRLAFRLGVIGGKLVLYGTRLGSGLWVMEEYGVVESWTKVTSIHRVKKNLVKHVCLLEDSNEDIVVGCKNRVIMYNKNERRCRDLGIIGRDPSEFRIGGTYVETLESLKRIRPL